MEYIKAKDNIRLPDCFDFNLRKLGTKEADVLTVVWIRDKKSRKWRNKWLELR